MRRVMLAVWLWVGLAGCGRTLVFDDELLEAPRAVITPAESTLSVGQLVTLDGSRSHDPEGAPLSFTWRVRSAGTLVVDGAQARFSPDRVGTFVVELIVEAGGRRSEPAVATITVTPAGPPIANAGPDQTGPPGQRFELDGSLSSDPFGAPLVFAWTLRRPAGSQATLSLFTTPRPSFTADVFGRYELTLTVTAGDRTATDDVVITATRANRAPIANAGAPQVAALGWVTLDGTASSDPDGDPLTFDWRVRDNAGPITLSEPTAARPRFFASVRGRYSFQLVVRDPQQEAGLDSTELVVVTALPDGGIDGGTGPGNGGDVFDPREIYLAGTFTELFCYRNAVAHWANPGSASAGFACNFDHRSAMIRPTDGRLLHVNGFEGAVREYRCDTCSYAGSYPTEVTANDPIVTNVCPNATDNKVEAFLVSADGVLLHTCQGTPSLWRDPLGAVVYGGNDAPVSLGQGGWVLTRNRVVNTQTMATNTIVGLPGRDWLTTRWNGPGGFFVALAGMPPMTPTQLWRVSTSGVAQLVGPMPPLPAGVSLVRGSAGGARLDGAGRLFQLGRDDNAQFIDVIVRSEVGGSATIVYTEATLPLVLIHDSSLMTGP